MSERITQYTRDGLTFDVIDSGPVGAGGSGDDRGTTPPVILLHGFPQRANSWDQVTPLLNAQGLRTLAPDQRGYSPGARPAGRRAYRMDELVADVIALADAIDAPTFHLVGHDWGAAVAWMVAANHPDRVATLTTVSVPHPAAFLRAMPRGQLLHSWYILFFQLPWLPERAVTAVSRMRRQVPARIGLPDGFIPKLQREIVDYGALRGGLGWYRGLPFGDPRDTGRRVSTPSTFVWSDHDGYIGAAAARGCAEYVTGPFDYIEIPDATHWLPETHATELADAIIARIDGPGATASGTAAS
ncbi:alpha/beta fold hydrolase [Gordonia sinesedis]